MQALTVSDLETLDKKQPVPSAIKQIRDHHHFIAILLAQGKGTSEVAQLMGMSISRISILKSDPSFKELIAAYHKRAVDAHLNLVDQIAATRLGAELLAAEELRDRLADEQQRAAIDTRTLIDIYSEMADRNGRTKVSRSENVNWKGDLADGLAEARRRRDVLLSASAPPPPEQRQPDAEKPESVSSPPAEPPTPAGEAK